jgi:hypothetical protein
MEPSMKMLVRLLPGLLVLVSACGGTPSDPDAGIRDAGADAGGMCSEFTPEYCPRVYPMSPVPMGAICEIFADMFCRANGNCCARPEEIYPTFSECISDQIARCVDPAQTYEHADALAEGRLTYNSGAMGEQRARLGTMSDQCDPVRFGDAIRMAMSGRVASGEACMASVECVDGHSCREGVCALDRALGGPCASHDECGPSGLQCEGGMCAARHELAAACTADEECESRLCIEGACAEPDDGGFYCVVRADSGRAFEH